MADIFKCLFLFATNVSYHSLTVRKGFAWQEKMEADGYEIERQFGNCLAVIIN